VSPLNSCDLVSQRPVFSSPVTPGWNGDPRAFLGAPHPAVTSDARPNGDRPRARTRNYAPDNIQSVLQSACSLISCDLVSHGRRVLLDGDRRVHRREQGARHQSRAVRRRHGGRCPRWNDANVQAQSLRTTSEAVLGEILDAWFAAEPSANADDRANIAHVDEIHA